MEAEWILAAAVVALLLALGYHVRNLQLLSRWLDRGGTPDPPRAYGRWDELHALVIRGRRESARRESELAAALAKLQKGRLHESPVKTRYGFHVLRLDDSRSAKVPSFEELRPKLLKQVQSRKFEELQASLRKAATLSE